MITHAVPLPHDNAARLKYYQQVVITGVFVNGSGDFYSTFDDVQSYVLAKLLLNVNDDVEALIRQFYAKYYPECGTMIGDYYLSLEKKLRRTNRVMPYYGTMQETISAYLYPKEFVSFWISLDKKSKSVSGTERQYINRIADAMAYYPSATEAIKKRPRGKLIILKITKAYDCLLQEAKRSWKNTSRANKRLIQRL